MKPNIKTIIILIFTVICNNLFSQNKLDLTFDIIDSTANTKIDYATIQLFDIQDTSLLKYATISDNNGYAKMANIEYGSYILEINHIAYKIHKQILQIDKKNNTKFNITLSPALYILNGVIVADENTGIIIKNDKIEFLPDSNSLKNTATAIDLLRKVPNISVKASDNSFKINGEPNVLILIDGNLTNRDIESIPSKDIEKIEIITNPSVRYDFNTKNILNIILKKNREKGLKILLSSRVGVINFGTWNNLQLDYDFGKFRFFINDNFNYHDFKMNYESNVTSMFSSYISEIKTNTIEPYRSKSLQNSIQYGFDYSIDSLNFFNFTGNFTFSNSKLNYLTNRNYLINNILEKKSLMSLNSENFSYPNNFSIFYKSKFKKGQELTFNTNFFFNNNITIQNQDNRFSIIDSTETQNYQKIENSLENYSLNSKIDYSFPIINYIETNFGIQHYLRTITEKYTINEYLETFKFVENRLSAFNSTKFNISNKLNIQLGIRLEEAFSKINDSINNNNFNYMPLFNVNWKINKSNQLRFSVLQKTMFIDYYYLTTNQYYSIDSTSLRSGNSYLKPSKESQIQLQYLLLTKIFLFSLAPQYSYIQNALSTKYITKNEGLVKIEKINLSHVHKMGGNIYLQLNILGIIEPYFEGEIFYYIFPKNENNGLAYSSTLGLDIALPLDFYMYYSFTFKSKELYFNGYYIDNYLLDDITIGKTFLNGQINTSIALRNFFPKLVKANETIEQTNYISNYQSLSQTRKIVFMFRYFFNKGKKIKDRKLDLNFEKEIDHSKNNILK
jgi:hypothetical protein